MGSVKIKGTPELVRPAGSHYLSVESHNPSREPFGKEELHPILELEAPRAGLVRASFEVSRSVASYWDRDTDTSSDQWGPWRVYLRDVRTPDPKEPGVVYTGRPAAGIGDATRSAITEACEPIVRAWLETEAYRVSRERAAARAVSQKLEVPADYRNADGRRLLERTRGDLTPAAAELLGEALAALERARELVDEVNAAD
jgi:hypothetical protein